jgi:beta-galactosidase GanA
VRADAELAPEPALGPPGVYEFAGDNSGADAEDPDLAGVVLVFYWSALEPERGQIDFSAIDDAIAPWAAAGKKVVLRFSAAGQAAWGGAAADGTPAWVYGDGVPEVDDDGTELPVYWNSAFVADYESILDAIAQRYDGDPALSFIEMGLGDGGETEPDATTSNPDRLSLWEGYGYSDGTWLSYLEQMCNEFRQLFPDTPVVAMLTSTFLGPDQWTDYLTLSSWLVENGFPLQYNALTSSSRPPPAPAWQSATTVVEQAEPTRLTGDDLAAQCSTASQAFDSDHILVYRSDVDSPSESGALAQCAAE